MKNIMKSYLENRKLYTSFSEHINQADHKIHEALEKIESLYIGHIFVGVRNDLLHLSIDKEYKKACKDLFENQNEAIRASKNLKHINEKVQIINQRNFMKNIYGIQSNPKKTLLSDYEGGIDIGLSPIEQIAYALTDTKKGFETVNPFFINVFGKYAKGLQDTQFKFSAKMKKQKYEKSYTEEIKELDTAIKLIT